MSRTFIAISLSKVIKNKLYEKVSSLGLTLKWSKPENWHLTLKFLGDLNSKEIQKTQEQLSDIVRHYPKFNLTLNKIILGPQNRMIWAVFKPQDTLISLQKTLSKALEALNLGPKEKREYFPHICLSRLKGSEIEIVKFRWQDLSLNIQFRVEKINLIKSRLKPSGAEYSLIKDFVLCGKQ